MPRELDTVVTYLAMHKAPQFEIRTLARFDVSLIDLKDPPVHYYRYLYNTIGAEYDWVDLKQLSDEELKAKITAPDTFITVAHVNGCPAGYFELKTSGKEKIWLEYFGIMPEYIGKGLGKWLLKTAINRAWSHNPKAVHVETCTLDHPSALPLYKSLGFEPYATKDKVTIVP